MTAPATSSSLPSTWPMTTGALSALEADIEASRAEVSRFGDTLAEDDGEPDRAESRFAHVARRLAHMRAVLEAAQTIDDPGVALIGRRVTLREEDGTVVTYSIVLPGDGDPDRGWVSAEAPLGRALLLARAGDVVTVPAPAGPRRVAITAVV